MENKLKLQDENTYNQKLSKLETLKSAFPHTIPILLGYIFMGMAFGILISSKGYNFLWSGFIALIMYSGSMQFVAIELLISPFNIVNSILMTITVNARHLFYGLSLLDRFKEYKGKKKWYMIFGLTDETFSLYFAAKPPENANKTLFYFFITLLNQIYWIVGCALGSIIGSMLTFNTKGIDFAMTALFVVIFIDQWKSSKNHIPALIGLGISLVSLLIFGPKNFIIPSMFGILITLTIFRSKLILRRG